METISGGRIDRLPKWAQDEFTRMKYELDRTKRKLAASDDALERERIAAQERLEILQVVAKTGEVGPARTYTANLYNGE